MNSKSVIGLTLGFGIGLGCSLLSIPVPAPPVLVGALLVVAMTLGYTLTDHFIATQRPKRQADNCGGPSGDTRDD